MRERVRRIVAQILVLVMLVGMMPVEALAKGNTSFTSDMVPAVSNGTSVLSIQESGLNVTMNVGERGTLQPVSSKYKKDSISYDKGGIVTVTLSSKSNGKRTPTIVANKPGEVTVTLSGDEDEVQDLKYKVTVYPVVTAEDATLSVGGTWSNYTKNCGTAKDSEISVEMTVSEGSDVVEVNGNQVKALREGVAKVTVKVTCNGVSASAQATLTVTKPGIAFENQSYYVFVGKTRALNVVPVPSSVDIAPESITWSVADSSIATVDQNGVVTGVAAGNTTITASLADDVNATADLTVYDAAIVGESTINIGQTTQLSVTGAPEGATVTWSAADTNMVTIDSNGNLTGHIGGKAIVYADVAYNGVTVRLQKEIDIVSANVIFKSNYPEDAKKFVYDGTNGAGKIVDAQETTAVYQVEPGTETFELIDGFNSTNYRFIGWLREGVASDAALLQPGTVVDIDSSNMTFLAQWERIPENTTSDITVNVTYHNADGSVQITKDLSGILLSDGSIQFQHLSNQEVMVARTTDDGKYLQAWQVRKGGNTKNVEIGSIDCLNSDYYRLSDGEYYVNVYPVYQAYENNTAPATFYAMKVGGTDGSTSSYYFIGRGTVQHINEINNGSLNYTNDPTQNVNRYVLQAPDISTIADIMNISLSEAQTLRWHKIILTNDGWHVDGMLYTVGKYWTIRYWDKGEIVKEEVVADTNSYNLYTNQPATMKGSDGVWVKDDGNELNSSNGAITFVTRDYNVYAKYPGKTSITVVKNWEDDSNKLNARPGSVTFTVTQSGSGTSTKTLTLNSTNSDDTGNTWTGVVEMDEAANGKYTYSVSETVPNGYTQSSFTSSGNTFTFTNKINDQAGYTVEHYLVNADGTSTLQDTVKIAAAKVGSTVTAEAKTYTGYKLDTTVSGTKQTGTVLPDGSLVLKLYYVKDSYKVQYTYTGTLIPGDANDQLPTDETHEYGKTVSVKPVPTVAGYTFSGWTTTDAEVSNGSFTMPAKDVTLTGSWTENDEVIINYTVNNAAAGTVSRGSESVAPATGTAQGSEATANAGYRFTGWKLTEDTNYESSDATVAPAKGDDQGSTIWTNRTYVAQFDKRTDLSYTVNYFWNGDKTTSIIDSKQVPNQTYQAKVTEKYEDLSEQGYTPVSTGEKSIIIDVDVDGTKNVISFYYYKNVELTANSDTVIYNGDEQSVSGYTGQPEGIVFEAVTAGAKGTNVTTSDNKYPAIFSDNAEGAVDTTESYIVTKLTEGELVINKRPVEITVNSVSYTYDGTPKTVEKDGSEYVVKAPDTNSGLVSGDTESLNVVYGTDNAESKILVGTYVAAVLGGAAGVSISNTNGDVTANYDVSVIPGTLTITGKPIIHEKSTPSVDSNYKLGEWIPFTIKVENITDDELTNITVTDETAQIVAGDGYTVVNGEAIIATLASGASVYVRAQHQVTEADILKGTYGNTATVTVDDKAFYPSAETDRIEDAEAKLVVSKVTTSTPDNGDTYALGETIRYSITVKNEGNVTIKDIIVTDELTGITGDKAWKIDSLAPGETSKAYTTEYTVTEADILKGMVLNEATAGGKDPNGNDPDVVPGEKEDPTEEPQSILDIDKTLTNLPVKGYFTLGETAEFDITVTNNGNLTLTNVVVTDELAGTTVVAGEGYTVDGLTATIATLAPGATVVVKATYTITEDDLGKELVNGVTATGKGPDDPTVPEKDHDPEEVADEEEIPTDEAIEITGLKTWSDFDNVYASRPETITLRLMADGQEHKSTTADKESNWAYTFSKLPLHNKEGEEVVYTVVEDEVAGYEAIYADDNAYNVTNELQNYTLTIRYWFGGVGGRVAAPTVSRTYFYGESYNVASPSFEGYTANMRRVMGVMEGDVEYDVIFGRNTYTLTVRYIFRDGTIASPTRQQSLGYGDDYVQDSPMLRGYTPSMYRIAGTMPGHDVTYAVIYVPDTVNVIIDEYGVPLGIGNVEMNVGDCFE